MGKTMTYNYKEMCPYCGAIFTVWEEEQVPGYRMKDYLYCPACKKELRASMEVEFNTEYGRD